MLATRLTVLGFLGVSATGAESRLDLRFHKAVATWLEHLGRARPQSSLR